MYHCAQINTRQHKPKKAKNEGVKHRDKEQMDTFKCHGWLSITITDDGDDAFVKFQHEDDHVPYWNIDVPSEIQDFVRENLELSPTQLWDEILKKNPSPSFSRKAIYQIWHENESKKWKRDPDEVKSAKILLEEASEKQNMNRNIYSVESIPLPDNPSFTAIAFCLPEVLRKWGGKVRELSLDSACEKYTLFSITYIDLIV
ncbi:hypothetical protein BDZ97DRAFT_1656387 [Flammula alnicola]|nr:hypothetical protein BDZ97DRAFT_1656387 [Flammula alnicola]